LEGAEIPYFVLNRYAFGVFGLPPVPGYSDCRVFVSAAHLDEATALLADLAHDFAALEMTPLQKIRVVVETYFTGAFVAARRPSQLTADEPDDATSFDPAQQ
jgi:hypothetical protein